MPNYKLGLSGRNYKLEAKNIVFKNLEELDNFTMKYNDERDLMRYLIDYIPVSIKDIKLEIKAFYNHAGEVKSKPIIYGNMKKYLDLTYLRARFHSLSNNIKFLKSLVNEYKGNPNQARNISEFIIYMNDVLHNGHAFYSRKLDNAIESFFWKEISKSSKKFDEETGKPIYIEDYSSIRNLALFMYDYDKKIEKENEKKAEIEKQKNINLEFEKSEQISMVDNIGNLNDSKETTLYDDIEDSFTFEDGEKIDDYIGDNYVDDEPLFPPYSSEARRYREYMDNLPDEDFEGEFHKRRR